MSEAQNLLQLEVVHSPSDSGVTSMQTVDNLKLIPVWVDPEHLVLSARILLRGHGLRVIGVVHGGDLIGSVSIERVLGESDSLPVSSVMDPLALVLDATESTRDVAQKFVQSDVDFAPVLKDGR